MHSTDKKLIDRLAQDKRNEMITIGREAMRRFGYAYQHVFDLHLPLFEFLADEGATATAIGQMLCEVGIMRDDGSALPPGTVSSAMSRARERHAARQSKDHRPAPSGTGMQVAAVGGNTMHVPADRGTTPGAGAIMTGMAPPAPAPSRAPAQLSQIRPSPKPSAQIPTATRHAVARLEQLRSDPDERGHDD